jgi:hypothetical protein
MIDRTMGAAILDHLRAPGTSNLKSAVSVIGEGRTGGILLATTTAEI